METYQKNFIDFIIQENALKFGEFTLKSGRVSPYFFNIGHIFMGQALAKLGQYYALALTQKQCQFDVLFGPAYKGIPLSVATTMQLAEQYNLNVPYCFNRKEAKGHGEKGLAVGAPCNQKRVMIIDDVITDGTSKKEAIEFIQQEGGKVTGIIIALDRQEKAQDSPASPVQLLEKNYQIPVASIIQLEHIISYIRESTQHQKHLESILNYQKQYGIK